MCGSTASGPAYVPRQGMKSRAAIDAIMAAGGIAVLAHYPAAPEQPTLIKLIMDWGVRGLEVFYRRFQPQTIAAMEVLANSLDLLVTGGSTTTATRSRTPRRWRTTYVPARDRRCAPRGRCE